VLLKSKREEILLLCKRKIMEFSPDAAAREGDLELGLPQLLDRIVGALNETDSSEIPLDAPRPPTSALLGMDVTELVHDYGALGDAITAVAEREGASISARQYQLLNHCLDARIAEAVARYASERDRELQHQAAEHLGFIAHELRNALATAMVSLEVLRKGPAAMSSSTAGVLERSLFRLQELIDQSLLEVRIRNGGPLQREHLHLAALVDEIVADVTIDARSREIEVTAHVDPVLELEADRRMITSVVTNLLQNALKFSRKGGHVALRGSANRQGVIIEVEDECGGLPDGDPEGLFQPFVQRGRDKSGLGLGLPITRRAAEAHGGTVRVRNLPGKGCIFVVALPTD
jgi:signal transduction histidine kinase